MWFDMICFDSWSDLTLMCFFISLGLGHDSGNASIPGECPDGINVMASGSVSNGKSLEWSKCSSDNLAATLRYVEIYW